MMKIKGDFRSIPADLALSKFKHIQLFYTQTTAFSKKSHFILKNVQI